MADTPNVRDVHLSAHGTGVAPDPRVVQVQKSLMTHNDTVARANREAFAGSLVLNVVSSPGSGKTALLEGTVRALAGQLSVAVIVGDLETDNDATRLHAAGAPSVQIATGAVCHLEAEMVARAAERLDLDGLDVLVVENVGNLVCPAAWDLGEDLRVVLLAVTEGEDKPLKYPRIFKDAHAVVINKIDIADAVGFDRDLALDAVHRVTPAAQVFELSARTGEGMNAWLDFLRERRSSKRG
ncbi:MAG: hydrogenase nickel incorporation protein HypB [Trueperaceae bacterium]|nr:hydrogenase nickel incorporation protein HypB [Trueperaceae bacterium]